MNSWLDLIPSSERMKKRMFNKEHYKRWVENREKIPTLEELEAERDRNSELAELSFAIETEPKLKEALKKQIEEDAAEQGIENLVYAPEGLSSEEVKAKLQEGFDISIDTNPANNKDQLMISPEGNIGEKLPMKFSVSDSYVGQFVSHVLQS